MVNYLYKVYDRKLDMNRVINFCNYYFEFTVLMSISISLLILFAVVYFVFPQLDLSFISCEKPAVMLDYTLLNNLPFSI